MISTASGDDYRRVIEVLAESDSCDAVLTIFVPPLVTQAADVAVGIREAATHCPEVTIAAVFMTSEGPPAELAGDGISVPAFEFPEDGARAIALAARHGRWRSRPAGKLADLHGVHPPEAAAIITHELAHGGGWLSPARVTELLRCYGIPLIETEVVPGVDEAVAAARALGRPVALKASADGLVHKSDAGGVMLDLDGRRRGPRGRARDQGRRHPGRA